jgi:hypothetical protein
VPTSSLCNNRLKQERMPAFYKIDKERRLVLTSGAGTFSMADALAHQNNLVNDPDFDPSFSQLMDFTQVTQIELSVNDIRRLAHRSIFSQQSRRAFIMPSDIAYGLARMFEMLREAAGENGIGVFRNLDEALDWILAKEERA